MAKWRRKADEERRRRKLGSDERIVLGLLAISLLLLGLVTAYFFANPGQIPPPPARNFRTY